MKPISAFLLLLIAVGCAMPPRPSVDADYALALSTANRFLEAWRSRHQEAGLALLSSRLRQLQTEDEWRLAISGISNPHHQSYEIANGKRLPDGRIQFDVWLHDHYTGQRLAGSPRQEAQQIIMIKVGAEDWKVDGVPQM